MAILAAAQEASESSDGLTITFSDVSNWSTSDPAYTRSDFVRTFTLSDAYGNALETLVLPTTSDTVEYELPADTTHLWVNSVFTIVGAVSLSETSKYPFFRVVKNLYRSLVKSYDCNDKDIDRALSGADRMLRGAEYEAISGDGAGWTSLLDNAYTYLTV